MYKDGSVVYPGTGIYNKATRPARISLQSPAGAYGPLGTEQAYDGSTAMYFRAHENLKWISTYIWIVAGLTGKVEVILWNDNGQRHFVTRHNVTNYQQIGVIWVNDAGVIDGVAAYNNGTGSLGWTDGPFDILVCQ